MRRFSATGSKQAGWVWGGSILRDVAGSGSLSTTQIYASVAYHQMLGYSSCCQSVSIRAGVNKTINRANLKFPDQFDGKFFDVNQISSVPYDLPNINFFDMQIGMNYAYFPDN